jgi:hypothetical protein
MRPVHRKLKANPSRRGAAILMLLVAIVILMMLYFLDIRAIFGPNLGDISGKPTARPWLQEDRLVAPDKLIEMPKPPKPTIDEDFTITCPVTSDGSGRGKVALEFNTAGEVGGNWHCEYSGNDRDYRFDADFTGNIDVTQTFSDDSGSDESLLYFITKGSYTHRIHNSQTGRTTEEKGIIYATGWLEDDYTASGKIVITDKEHSFSVSFNWQTE